MRNFFFVICVLPSIVTADDWSVNYERAKCNSNSDPTGDVKLVCAESETVRNLQISLSQEELSSSDFFAVANIENNNEYPVLVKTILIDALDQTERVVGFCSNRVNKSLYSGQSIKFKIGCSFQAVLPENRDLIKRIKVRATPWE